ERLEATNGHRVSRPDRENSLARQMRGKLDLRTVVQDQPVDLAARRQRVLLDRTSGRGELRRIPQRTRGLRVEGRSGRKSDRGDERPWQDPICYRRHPVSPDAICTADAESAIGMPIAVTLKIQDYLERLTLHSSGFPTPDVGLPDASGSIRP